MSRRSREALRYFLGPHTAMTAALLSMLVVSAGLEGLTAASLFPFVAAVVGQSMEGRGGPVLHFLSQMVNRIPIEDKVMAAVLLLVAIVLLKGGAVLVREALIAYEGARVVHEAKQTLVSRWAQAPYLFFKNHSGHSLCSEHDLHHQLSVAPQSLGAVLLLLPYAVTQIFTMTVIAALLFSMDWRLTLIIGTAGFVVYFVVSKVADRVSYAKGLGQREQQAIENRIVREFLQGIREILVARASTFWVHRFEVASERFRCLYASDLVWQSVPRIFLESFFFVFLCALVVIYRWLMGGSSVGFLPAMAVYAYAVYRLVGSSSVFSGHLAKINSKCPDVELLFDAIHAVPERVRGGGQVPSVLTCGITFDHVSLVYPDRADPALRDICIEIPKGAITAIVGENGSGKSTLVNLIGRLLEPTAGRILVDGQDLTAFDRDAWLGEIGYVGAGCFLFSGTIEENIRFDLASATRQDVEAAALAAHAHDFITQLPQGYGTIIGDQGVSISDGQRQRLAIARAVLRKPQVLIFDEGMSAVDPASETLIQNAISEVARETTLILVAHRLSTVQLADQIVVLHRGQVVEMGSHEELLVRKGQYSLMMAAVRE